MFMKVKKLMSDSKSIAIRVLLQPLEKTFSDEEIESISNQIIDTIDFYVLTQLNESNERSFKYKKFFYSSAY